MAVSQIEEKILGRLARQQGPLNPILSSSLFQILGLSILLSRKLIKARRVRKLDTSRDTKSLQLYHHIIWLAREGLSIAEVHILPYCQDGEQGTECRVMAAKLRASFYHVFCLFHNHPPVGQLSAQSHRPGRGREDRSSPLTPKADNGQTRRSPGQSPQSRGKENDDRGGSRRKAGKKPLRDPIPSMTSEASYVTNPFAAAGPVRSPPPAGPPPPIPTDAQRRTPTRPPGLVPINIAAPQAAASFLLPPLNFVPMAAEHFDTTQQLATRLLPPTHALRLAVALEHTAFLWDCASDHDRARSLARRTIRAVYDSKEGLDDDEFADAAALVQALGGIVRRASDQSTPRQTSGERNASTSTSLRYSSHSPPSAMPPVIDRAIAVSPKQAMSTDTPSSGSPQQQSRSTRRRSPETLSTVPEVESSTTSVQGSTTALSPPVSRLNSRNTQYRRAWSAASSEKEIKRREVEAAEERYRREQQQQERRQRNGKSRTSSSRDSPSSSSSQRHSRQPTPQEGLQRSVPPSPPKGRPSSPPLQERSMAAKQGKSSPEDSHRLSQAQVPLTSHKPLLSQSESHTSNSPRAKYADEWRDAVLRAIEIISSVSRGLYVPSEHEGGRHGTQQRLV